LISLTCPLENELEYKGKIYALNLAFDAVLRAVEALNDDCFTIAEKIVLMTDILIVNPPEGLAEKSEILREIYAGLFDKKQKGGQNNEKTVDFKQDAPYIYASFLTDYGIDLLKVQGELDWRKFIALFQGLSERTIMRQVISIRTRKIPKPNERNAEEIAELKRLKASCALEPSEKEKQAAIDRYNKQEAKRAALAREKVKNG
jgi:hypothetical protein